MERRVLQSITARIIFFLFVIGAGMPVIAQAPEISGRIHIPLWAHLEAYPGIENYQYSKEAPFEYPISRIRETAPFLIEGMVYGWRFTYVPPDRIRQVSEYFTIEAVRSITPEIGKITYTRPWIEESRLYCWVDFEPTPFDEKARLQWTSTRYPKIQGKGFGALSEGFDGIAQACKEAAKLAVREYARTIEKNKPQEIEGTLLITGSPKLGVDSGRYSAVLDFFLDVGTIKKYQY